MADDVTPEVEAAPVAADTPESPAPEVEAPVEPAQVVDAPAEEAHVEPEPVADAPAEEPKAPEAAVVEGEGSPLVRAVEDAYAEVERAEKELVEATHRNVSRAWSLLHSDSTIVTIKGENGAPDRQEQHLPSY